MTTFNISANVALRSLYKLQGLFNYRKDYFRPQINIYLVLNIYLNTDAKIIISIDQNKIERSKKRLIYRALKQLYKKSVENINFLSSLKVWEKNKNQLIEPASHGFHDKIIIV
ncbi:hypothetical protein BpHYR1_034022 [Brachionus plicatilis]|uniref:Uncharacterized protein n=1 Tax=Brachionus plicatilis TaxID=10195 RepID=A0A3M7PHI6_BRAPC|nr:hypothetical protein BpHYR1_034022 [Brachionus plicatilis]